VVAALRHREPVEDGFGPVGAGAGVRGGWIGWPTVGRPVAGGDEQQPRRAEEPQAAAPHGEARQADEAVDEHGVVFRHAVAVGILDERDTVPPARVGPQRPFGVGQVLGDQQPPGRIDGRGDRVDDHRLTGQERDLHRDARRDRGPGCFRRQRVAGALAVDRRGAIRRGCAHGIDRPRPVARCHAAGEQHHGADCRTPPRCTP